MITPRQCSLQNRWVSALSLFPAAFAELAPQPTNATWPGHSRCAGAPPIPPADGASLFVQRSGKRGTQQRVTYTCVGDNVNLAAHLEAHTKVLGLPILIDENTCAGLSNGIRVESHG
jgi:hypothetical protein